MSNKIKTSKTLQGRNEYWGFYIKHLSKQERNKITFERFCKQMEVIGGWVDETILNLEKLL